MAKTKAPSGLTLTREGRKFTAGWKQGETYAKQAARLRVFGANDKVLVDSLAYSGSSSATSLSGTVSASTWAKASYVRLYVWGKASDKETSTLKTKDFVLYSPKKPEISCEFDSDTDNSSTWTVEIADDEWDSGHYPVTSVTLQTSTDNGGSWKSYSSYTVSEDTATKSFTIVETAANVSLQYYKRSIRARTTGPVGDSSWVSAYHEYGNPARVTISKTGSVCNDTVDGLQIYAAYSVTKKTLTDTTEIQYALATPTADIAEPVDASWDAGATFSGTGTGSGTTGTANFIVDEALGYDECVFVRGVATHDNQSSYGEPVMLKTGYLTAPVIESYRDNGDGTLQITVSQESDVDGAWVEVYYIPDNSSDKISIGTITADQTGEQTFYYNSAYVGGTVCVRAMAGTGAVKMGSAYVYADSAPVTPINLTVMQASGTGRALVTWEWSGYGGEDLAEVSWSDDEDAWESNNEPTTYEVTRTANARLYVTGLDTGSTYWFRARYAETSGDDTVYGAYTDAVSVTLTSETLTPVLALSDSVAAPDGFTTAIWDYSGNGEQESFALAMSSSESMDNSVIVATGGGAQSAELDVAALGLTSGTYYLAVTTKGVNAADFEQSNIVALSIAEAPVCTLTSSLTDGKLTSMPLTATVTGMGDGGTAVLSIVRAEDYQVDRPDETTRDGFSGESVWAASMSGVSTASFSIDVGDLTGYLDDGAGYTLEASIADELGQTAAAAAGFTVEWAAQPSAPIATVVVDADQLVCAITPANESINDGDSCDIYRLTADKPVLVVKGGEFGETYVDPYPAFGGDGGYRVATRSATGDVITADSQFAWTDCSAPLDHLSVVIDFDGGQLDLPYDISLSHSWDKGYERTKYLNGAQVGDWAAGVERDLSMSTIVIPLDEMDTATIESMRRLAVHEGACHVRTPEGSSITADVQVAEDMETSHLVSYSLTISAEDPDGTDGMTHGEWVDGGGDEMV